MLYMLRDAIHSDYSYSEYLLIHKAQLLIKLQLQEIQVKNKEANK